MKINLGLSGANGRMGKSIIKLIATTNPEFNLALLLTKNHNIDLIKELPHVKVLIDFSTPNSCLEYLRICAKLNIPVVIGTTGFTSLQQQEIIRLADHIPILQSPNMSIGVNIIKYLLGLLSKFWSYNYIDPTMITINETHHKNKKDAPSGTALMLGEVISNNFLSHPNINFNSKRIGQVKGKHQVVFANNFEEVAIVHKAKDRKIFAKGALLAAKWMVTNKANLSPKLYNFADVMHFEQGGNC